MTLTAGAALDDAAFAAIVALAEDEAGLSLPPTKRDFVAARVGRRMRALGLSHHADYLPHIATPGQERIALLGALTTNVSRFFREPHHYELLRTRMLPGLIDYARAGGRVRLWSAGCAAGQEAVSMAMVLLETFPDAPSWDVRILGTDLDPEVIRCASAGLYPAEWLSTVPPDLRSRHLVPTPEAGDGMLRVSPEVARLSIFRHLNLHGRWPMPGRFDVIFCRNTAMYLTPSARRALWRRMQEHTSPGGWLAVGHAERVPDADAPEFELVGPTTYRRTAEHPAPIRPRPYQDRTGP
ncbi:MAG: CheR family methyltransferase [Shimia sp.]